MLALILANAKPTAELQVQLEYVDNYRDCLRDLTAGTHPQPVLTPAIEPFESIKVTNEESNRFPWPGNQSRGYIGLPRSTWFIHVAKENYSDLLC